MSSPQSSVQIGALVSAGISVNRVNICYRHTVVIFLPLARTLISFMPRCQKLALDTTCGSLWNPSPDWYFLFCWYAGACRQVWVSASGVPSEGITLAALATQVTLVPEESWARTGTVICFKVLSFFEKQSGFIYVYVCLPECLSVRYRPDEGVVSLGLEFQMVVSCPLWWWRMNSFLYKSSLCS